MKKNNKFISLLICMLMVISTIPKTVHADTEQGPIEIDAVEQDITEAHGDITTDDDDALSIYASNGYTANITAGDLTSTDDDGLYVYVEDDGHVIADVGNITSYDDAVFVTVSSSDSDDQSSADITTGDIDSGYYGINLSMNNEDGNVNIETGNITSEDDGIYANNYGGYANIETGSIDSGYNGIRYEGDNDSGTYVFVNGDIYAEEEGIEADVSGEDDPFFYADVNGSVYTGGNGIDFSGQENSETIAFVAGDVEASDTGATLYAMDNAYVGAIVQGDLTSLYAGAKLYGDDSGRVSLYANSVNGGNAGIMVSNYDDSQVEAVVLESVEGGVVAIAVDSWDSENREGATVVAWSVELNERGNVAESYTYVDDDIVYLEEADEDFEKNSILYLIKMLQPENGLIEVTDEDGTELDSVYIPSLDEEEDGEYIPTAFQDQKVLVKVTPTEGYSIKGVYNGLGDKVDLLVDDEGNYYVVVPKGGAVYLTADLELDDYSIINKEGDPHEIGSGNDLVVEIAAPIEEYEATYVDDEDVSQYATVTEGSTIVTLASSFLDTLSKGAHNLFVLFSGGEAETTFTVKEKDTPAPTDDDDDTTVITHETTKTASSYKSPSTGVDEITVVNHSYKSFVLAAFAAACAIAAAKKGYSKIK